MRLKNFFKFAFLIIFCSLNFIIIICLLVALFQKPFFIYCNNLSIYVWINLFFCLVMHIIFNTVIYNQNLYNSDCFVVCFHSIIVYNTASINLTYYLFPIKCEHYEYINDILFIETIFCYCGMIYLIISIFYMLFFIETNYRVRENLEIEV